MTAKAAQHRADREIKRVRQNIAHAKLRIQRSRAKPKPHKMPPAFPKRVVRAAIKKFRAHICKVAKEVGTNTTVIRHLMARPGWEDIAELWERIKADESDKLVEHSERALMDSLTQRLDPVLRAKTAQWILTRAKHKGLGYGDLSKLVIEGGDKPLLYGTQIPVDALALPVETRRQILEAAEKYDDETESDS